MMAVKRWLEEAAPGRVREYVIVIIVAMIQSFLWSMMVPVIPLLARSLGANEVELGLIATMSAVVAVVFSIPGGAFVTRYGKRAAFVGCGLMSVFGGFLYLTTKSLPMLILPQLLHGGANMLFWPTEKTYLTEIIPLHLRAKVVGYTMAITVGGSVFGPIASGWLIDNVGFSSVFYLYMGFGALAALMALPLPKGDRDLHVSLFHTLTESVGQLSTFLKRPVLLVATLLTFTQNINCASTEYFLPVYLRDMGYTATFIGSTVTVRTIGMSAIRLIVGDMANRFNMMYLLLGALGLSGLAVGLIPLIPSAGYALLGSFVGGVAFGVSPVLMAAVVAEATEPRERNIAMALDSTSMYGGRVFTGAAVGAVAGIVGYGSAIVLGNGLVMAAMVGLTTLYNRTVMRPKADYEAGIEG